MAAVVKSDGVSEYFEEDSLWDSFAVNFFEFLENVAIHPNPHCTDVFIRHDLLSCIMRLLTVRCLFVLVLHYNHILLSHFDRQHSGPRRLV